MALRGGALRVGMLLHSVDGDLLGIPDPNSFAVLPWYPVFPSTLPYPPNRAYVMRATVLPTVQ
eukprot:2304285-Rhodomonas_salina.1